MYMVGDMKCYPFDELVDEMFGPVGTPRRDKFEAAVDEAVEASRMGAAVRQARQAQHLTQEELGQRVGINRTQVCRIERGCNASLRTISRLFRAMGVAVSMDIAGIGRIDLC